MVLLLALLACGTPASAPARAVPAILQAGVGAAPTATPVGRPFDPFAGARWLQGAAPAGGDVLVVFWEPWCPACREELPQLALWGGGGRVEVVALTSLSRGQDPAAAQKVLQTARFGLPVGVVDGAVFADAGVTSIPWSVLLRDGHVTWAGSPREARRRMGALLR